MRRGLEKIAPYVIVWAMGMVTYHMAENLDKGFSALIAIVEVFK